MYYRGGYGNNAQKRQRVAEHGPSYRVPSIGFDNAPPPIFPVIRIRGLPFYSTENDVASFFFGLDVVDVLMVHKLGRFTGEAFVVFGYPLQVDIALRKDRQNLGSRYVEVFPSKREEYYKAIAREVQDARDVLNPPPSKGKVKVDDDYKTYEKRESKIHATVLRLRGLPYSAAKYDIAEFFKDFKLSEDAIHFVMNSEGRASGDAFVEFASVEDANAAMAYDRKSIGNRYVELFPSTPEEMSKALPKSI